MTTPSPDDLRKLARSHMEDILRFAPVALDEAADEIERLRATLERIAGFADYANPPDPVAIADMAQSALGKSPVKETPSDG